VYSIKKLALAKVKNVILNSPVIAVYQNYYSYCVTAGIVEILLIKNKDIRGKLTTRRPDFGPFLVHPKTRKYTSGVGSATMQDVRIIHSVDLSVSVCRRRCSLRDRICKLCTAPE